MQLGEADKSLMTEEDEMANQMPQKIVVSGSLLRFWAVLLPERMLIDRKGE